MHFAKSKNEGSDTEFPYNPKLEASFVSKGRPPTPAVPESEREDPRVQQMQVHKLLYFKLQNLERYPEVLPQSRDLLISLLSEALDEACKEPDSGILFVKHFTRDGLTRFLQGQNDKTMHEWEQYLARRKNDWRMKMFGGREDAEWWLKQVTPVKYVDGAWLGHVNKITTPFAFRQATRDAWQVLSEELGDGDLDKNHVEVYRELMKDIEPGLPDGDTINFIHPQHNLKEPSVWKAAIAQLLISLFPHEFLPEILGFNMHFELLTLETLKAAKELAELKLNAYYFALHISIDNSDSGHTAMAKQAVIKYLEHVGMTQGQCAVQQVWKRVQAGYILSENLSASLDCPSRKKIVVDSFPRNELEAEVISIFKAKAPVAHKIHCSSQMKIGRQTLVDWLAPEAFASRQWQMDFLEDLKEMKPWVHKGEGSKSKLIKELSWPGKMFGSFTQNEVEVVKRWIDGLGARDPRFYWSFVDRAEIPSDQVFQNQNICVDYPVFSPVPTDALSDPSILSSSILHPPAIYPPAKITAAPNMSRFLPLWFAHPCLLESFVCIPSKTTTRTACSVTRLLRAQYGFGAEGPGVAGMDEVRRAERVGLVELGLEMTKRAGLPEPACLADVLKNEQSEFAVMMLHWSMRPMRNASLLLGLASAFMGLHRAVAASPVLLSAASREVLGQIACREQASLDICLEELRADGGRYADFCRGYHRGRAEIEGFFDQDHVTA